MIDKIIMPITAVIIILFVVFSVWVTFIADCSKLKWLPIGNAPLRCLEVKAVTMEASVPENEVNKCIRILQEANYLK